MRVFEGFETWKRRENAEHPGVRRENGKAAVIFLTERTIAPLNGRRFARECIFKKSPHDPRQDLRRLRMAEVVSGGVNPSMVSNGQIPRTEKRPFRRLSLSRGTNLAWKCDENFAISHCAFHDREMRFVPGILCPQKGVRRIRHGLRGFVNGSFMTRESA